MNYTHLKVPAGKNNMGGLTTKAFYAPVKAFSTIKGVMTTTNPGDSVTINGPHVFNLNEGFIELYCTIKKGKYKATVVGDIDGKGYKIEGELFYPGTDAEAIEIAAAMKNEVFILLVKESNGKVLQAGDANIPCYMTGDYDVAELESGTKGFLFKFETYANSMYIYPSPIEIKTIE